jgi:hypothetical protein
MHRNCDRFLQNYISIKELIEKSAKDQNEGEMEEEEEEEEF